jgi:hypothetical protein
LFGAKVHKAAVLSCKEDNLKEAEQLLLTLAIIEKYKARKEKQGVELLFYTYVYKTSQRAISSIVAS